VTAQVRVPESDSLWQLTMEHSPVGMAIVSPAGDLLTVNAALCDMLGREPDELATMTFQSVTHPDDVDTDQRLVRRALEGRISSFRITKRYLRADGSIVHGDLSVALLRAPDGSPVHFIAQVVDITERQAFVERLDAAEALAESAVKVKDDFVATVSHELRTPLTSALAHLELLDDSRDVGVEGHQQVSAARRNVLRLSHLVADLLFAARASAGSQVVAPHRLDLATVLGEAVDSAALDAAGADVRIERHGPDSVVAVADGMRLRQVCDNLLANAIAYNRRGGVVRVELAEECDRVVLTVADEGEGIDRPDMGSVFTRFFRGDNARRLQVPGAGLGLDIVRTIVEAHAGEVSLDSTPGAGTTVRVALPR
jgi:PAS domain S-box-containing protein